MSWMSGAVMRSPGLSGACSKTSPLMCQKRWGTRKSVSELKIMKITKHDQPVML